MIETQIPFLPWSLNQPLHNNIVYNYIVCTINDANGGARNVLHVLQIAECVSCDALPTHRQCSCGEDLLTLNEYHLIRVQLSASDSESTNTQCVLYTLQCVHSELTLFV